MILEILNQITTADIVSLIGGGTAGSIATQLITKFINRKKDDSDISSQQAILLKTVNDDLSKVVTALQDIACYRNKCKDRLNGETL